MADCLYLVKNGVPYSVAFALEPDERLAYVVIFGQLDGNDFDFDRGQWKERK